MAGSGTVLDEAIGRMTPRLAPEGPIGFLVTREIKRDLLTILEAATLMNEVNDAVIASSLARDGWEMIEAAMRGGE